MIKKIALLLGFFFGFSCILFGQVQLKKTPNWVRISDYDINPEIYSDENSQGTIELLYDNQVNCVTEEIYYRFVIKIVENVGIQAASMFLTTQVINHWLSIKSRSSVMGMQFLS